MGGAEGGYVKEGGEREELKEGVQPRTRSSKHPAASALFCFGKLLKHTHTTKHILHSMNTLIHDMQMQTPTHKQQLMNGRGKTEGQVKEKERIGAR